MSDVNKLDDADLKCPLDPNQYNIGVDNITVPAGSFAWAISLVYVGKFVRRNGWNAQVEYIKLLPGSMDNNVLPQIGIVDKKGTTSWQPTQKDMMACDWILLSEVKPVECMLSFDLGVGTSQYANGGGQNWGYLTEGGALGAGEYTFGTLTNLQDTLGIGSILSFELTESPIGRFWFIQLQVDTQNQPDLGSKTLEVTVNGSAYNLGTAGNSTTDFYYGSDGAKQLGDFLKQNVGNTTPIHFCFNWK